MGDPNLIIETVYDKWDTVKILKVLRILFLFQLRGQQILIMINSRRPRVRLIWFYGHFSTNTVYVL